MVKEEWCDTHVITPFSGCMTLWQKSFQICSTSSYELGLVTRQQEK